MSWLLDTCAISEYARKAPAPQVIVWVDEQDGGSLFLSVITHLFQATGRTINVRFF